MNCDNNLLVYYLTHDLKRWFVYNEFVLHDLENLLTYISVVQ